MRYQTFHFCLCNWHVGFPEVLRSPWIGNNFLRDSSVLAKYDLEWLIYHSSSLNSAWIKHLYPMCTIFKASFWYMLLDVHIWQGHQHSLQKCFTIKCNCKWNQRVIEVYSWQTPCNHPANPPFHYIFHYIVSLTHSVLISPHMGSLVANEIAFITKPQ